MYPQADVLKQSMTCYRALGPPKGFKPLPDTVASLLEKIGMRPVIPENVDKLCCGLPFASHGM